MRDNEKTYFSNERSELLEYFPSVKGPILDIGCASGLFGRQLKQAYGDNIEIWGVEPFKEAADEADRYLDKVYHGTIEDVIGEIPDNYFGCIVFNDSLEHMINPYRVLEIVRIKLLKNSGKIFASIPNVRYYMVIQKLLFNKDWEYEDEGVLDRTHLRFFTEKSIRRMFDEAGYFVESISGLKSVRRRHRRKLEWLNRLSPSLFGDLPYLQFACVAAPFLKYEDQERDS